MPAKPKARKIQRRLESLSIGEVSLVDSPAIGESFLVAKRLTDEEFDPSPTVEFTMNRTSKAIAESQEATRFWLKNYIEIKHDLEVLKATTKGT